LTITEQQSEGALAYQKMLKKAGFRVEVDDSNDKISAKIRRAQLSKIPMMLVVGAREIEQGQVTLRHVDGTQEAGLSIDDLIAKAKSLLLW
jgi:threonyl-tRNA synthetase